MGLPPLGKTSNFHQHLECARLRRIVTMGSYIDDFRSSVDSEAIRSYFPEITETEEPIWRGRPTSLSMADKYVLGILVLFIHLLFFAGDWLEPEGDGRANFIISLIVNLVDLTGAMGFAIIMLLLTKINHYANFSTSGKWTTSWLLVASIIPLIWKIIDIVEWLFGLVGYEFSNPLPTWDHLWFAPLGVFSFLLMSLFTMLYQRSFDYAITDKRIHIRKNLLYLDTDVHGISFHKVENLKADPTILGRILGFGNVHIVTGSGVGLQVESLGLGTGITTDVRRTHSGYRRVFSLIIGWITIQRERSEMSADPANCLYGVKSPMDIYRLINELMDSDLGTEANDSSWPDSE